MDTSPASRVALALALLVGGTAAARADAPPAGRPNIVLILADDLGYGDVGCYGGATPTPHIDRLAREGVRLTTFYANAPECTPTRAALLTGRYQHRVGGLECAIGIANVGRYDDAIRLAAARDLGLPATDGSLARLLKAAGHRTAITGKWHLGYELKFLPARHGFDESFGPLGGGVDYFHHTEPDGTGMLYRNGERITRDGYMTDLITDEAAAFVRRTTRPFFLYVPYTAPHTPIQGPADRRDTPLLGDEFQRLRSPETYAAMIRRLDDGVGTILRALDETGRANDTVVIFTSDNGGTRLARNAPFSGHKSQTFEGGIRVPCLVRWPGALKAGTVSDHVGITMDLTASLVRLAGATPPAAAPFDGIDLLRQLETGAPPQSRTLFWRFRRGEQTWAAVRDGALKWVAHQQGNARAEHLFDLAADPAEKTNLLTTRPADADRLRRLYAKWEADVRPSR